MFIKFSTRHLKYRKDVFVNQAGNYKKRSKLWLKEVVAVVAAKEETAVEKEDHRATPTLEETGQVQPLTPLEVAEETHRPNDSPDILLK